MSYWDTLPPTTGQENAINTYNKGYGIKLHINTKQQAHDIISTFAPKQVLEFENGVVSGTNITFDVIDKDLFSRWGDLNSNFMNNVESIEIKDGQAIIGVRVTATSDVIKSFNDSMHKMIEEESLSEYEDSLGYLDKQDLDREADMYGPDPILTGRL